MNWQPVPDSEVTRGLAAMIVFNGLYEYADCRLCRQVPRPEGTRASIFATPERIAALEYVLDNSLDEHNVTYPETQAQLAVLDAMLAEMKGEATDG